MRGKGGKTRLCPLLQGSARALADLAEGRASGEAVFLNRLGRPITRSGIRQVVERCAASYETVKRFVRPLRETRSLHAAVTRTRFQTPPRLQSQIDCGQARVRLGAAWEVRHVFVLTLGFSRRSVYVPCLSEALGDLLDAHEQAAHFGGHTQEHLYDRPRTVCLAVEPSQAGERTAR